MMNIQKIAAVLLLASFLPISELKAGNEDRSGEAGATELLINPWARSSGLGGANTASVMGLEAMYLNVAGMAYTRKTELMFTHTKYLLGTGININAFGLSQRVGEGSVLGFSVVAMNFGEIDITTVNNPEGGLGKFSPSYMNLGLSYAKEFSNSISGGLTLKMVNEAISNIRTQGMALDAGVRYVTGENDQIKFGIALKNVGPPMRYAGDGLSFRNTNQTTGVNSTEEHRSAQFELPSLLNIGASYDFFLIPKTDSTGDKITSDHKLTACGTFTSNSFTRDQYRLGLEYSFKSMLSFRAGYVIDRASKKEVYKGITPEAHTGPSAGFSFDLPFNKNGSTISFDYSYRFTNPFQGTHSIGARINL